MSNLIGNTISLIKRLTGYTWYRQKTATSRLLKNEDKKRLSPGPMKAKPKYGLVDTQIYQMGTNYMVSLEKATGEKFRDLQASMDTEMASIGTCFAEEFSTFMKASNGEMGKYLYVEENVFNSSANWGRVYTIPNLLQIVRYSLTSEIPVYIEECSKGFFDPLREYSVGYKASYEEAYASTERHRSLSGEVFTRTQVLVITLGQNEGWLDIATSYMWGVRPPSELIEKYPGRFKPVEASYQKNLSDLQAAISLLLSANEKLRIIFTVSPVAAAATFLDTDVITQSFAGKCMLRSIVKEVVSSNKDRVFYFPSFEIVLGYNTNSFIVDNRHVLRPKVDEIFTMLGNILKKNRAAS